MEKLTKHGMFTTGHKISVLASFLVMLLCNINLRSDMVFYGFPVTIVQDRLLFLAIYTVNHSRNFAKLYAVTQVPPYSHFFRF